jgi:predicted transcriptional regulator
MTSDTLTLPLTPALKERLADLARDMGRNPAEVARMATDAYIEANAGQVRQIREALDEANSGEPGVPHEEVMDWLASWGTDHELPRPTPRRKGGVLQ